jgi:hypothetical protein
MGQYGLLFALGGDKPISSTVYSIILTIRLDKSGGHYI